MSAPFQPPSAVWHAIEIYLKQAYDGPPPFEVRARLESLREQSNGAFYECPVLERDLHRPPTRYSLRLGNRNYPHMKLSLQASPDDSAFLFKADTHDKHCCPTPKSPDYKTFLAMMEANEALAKRIEAVWEAEHLPTFRQFLRSDLERRQAAAQNTGTGTA